MIQHMFTDHMVIFNNITKLCTMHSPYSLIVHLHIVNSKFTCAALHVDFGMLLKRFRSLNGITL